MFYVKERECLLDVIGDLANFRLLDCSGGLLAGQLGLAA